MTARELAQNIGGHGVLSVAGLRVRVKVLDVRQAFGRIDYLVTPIAGSNEKWVQADGVKLDEIS